MKKLAETVRINYLEFWETTKGLQQAREHLDEKSGSVSGTVNRNRGMLTYLVHPPLPSPVVAMKITARIPGTQGRRTGLLQNELPDLSGGFLEEWLKELVMILSYQELTQCWGVGVGFC